MNYHHIYHAGNFADVFKHIILTRIIEYFKRKETAFRVYDTHAGIGLYDLQTPEAKKTSEWKNGIAYFLENIDPNPNQYAILKPWLDSIEKVNKGNLLANSNKKLNEIADKIRFYPGSPFFIYNLLRSQDRLSLLELNDKDYKILLSHFQDNYRVKVTHLDGYLALKGHLPPKEKRGLVFIDPPFEKTDEFQNLYKHLHLAQQRFAHGVYTLWYPIKEKKKIADFIEQISTLNFSDILRLEIHKNTEKGNLNLTGCGLLIINPPYTLEQDFDTLTPIFYQGLTESSGSVLKEWICKA